MRKHIFFSLSCLLCTFACTCTNKVQKGYIPVSNNGQVYYERCGEGEPILLLHGHSLDRRMWDGQFTEFAKAGYSVVRIDFRGYGLSSPQTEDFQFTHMDDVLTVMDSLCIGKAHVVGLSMGSFVAGDMVAMCPERMYSCVLASGGIRGTKGPSEPMDSVESAQRDREIAALKEKGIEAYKAEWLEALIASGGTEREKMREPLKQMIDDWSAWQPLHKEVRLFYAREAMEVLKQKRPDLPVLFVVGGTENPDPHPSMLPYLPNGKLVVLPDCGHMLNMDQPQAFNKTVLEFLHKTRVTRDRATFQ